MLPPKAWNLKAKIRHRRQQKALDDRLSKLQTRSHKTQQMIEETTRKISGIKEPENDIDALQEHSEKALERIKALEQKAESRLIKVIKRPKPTIDVILKARELGKEGFFNRVETNRTPDSHATDIVILDCGHSTCGMPSEDPREPHTCSDCIKEWMDKQMKNRGEGVA